MASRSCEAEHAGPPRVRQWFSHVAGRDPESPRPGGVYDSYNIMLEQSLTKIIPSMNKLNIFIVIGI